MRQELQQNDAICSDPGRRKIPGSSHVFFVSQSDTARWCLSVREASSQEAGCQGHSSRFKSMLAVCLLVLAASHLEMTSTSLSFSCLTCPPRRDVGGARKGGKSGKGGKRGKRGSRAGRGDGKGGETAAAFPEPPVSSLLHPGK